VLRAVSAHELFHELRRARVRALPHPAKRDPPRASFKRCRVVLRVRVRACVRACVCLVPPSNAVDPPNPHPEALTNSNRFKATADPDFHKSKTTQTKRQQLEQVQGDGGP